MIFLDLIRNAKRVETLFTAMYCCFGTLWMLVVSSTGTFINFHWQQIVCWPVELWITMSPSNQKICFQHQCLCGLEDHGHEFQQLFLPPHTRNVTHESTPSVKIVTPKRKLAHKLHLEPLPPQASFQKAFLDDIALCSELFQQLFLPPLTRSVTYEHTVFSLGLFSLWA